MVNLDDGGIQIHDVASFVNDLRSLEAARLASETVEFKSAPYHARLPHTPLHLYRDFITFRGYLFSPSFQLTVCITGGRVW
jgi:hypothetical protein